MEQQGGLRDGMQVIGIGQKVTVRLAEAIPVTGGLTLELLSLDGTALPRSPRAGKKGRFSPRKPGASAARDAKLKRKVIRKRR